jgi:tRNA-splicing ligase RtcB
MWRKRFAEGYKEMIAKFPKLEQKEPSAAPRQLGTLGGGNHFIELCLDEAGCVWVMLHSGSRGIGNKIGVFFIERAKEIAAERDIALADKNLAWLEDGSADFRDYVRWLGWAQDYARANRDAMLRAVLAVLQRHFPDLALTAEAVNCHHNYASLEEHFGHRVWVTRKGAVRAGAGEFGIIPGSMGAKSFIVRGKGNAESFMTCSHGAGRKMSRTAAKKAFTLADHAAATAGVECRKDGGVLDETPGAYKDIDAVMAAQSDLVEVVHTLKQVVCVKG